VKVIRLVVVRLELESSADCAKDSLTIYDGWTADVGVLLARLCGTDELPLQPYVTRSNVVVIRFVSDETGSGTGFAVEYQPRAADIADMTDSATARHHRQSTFTVHTFVKCQM